MKKLEEIPRDGTLYGYGTAGIEPHTFFRNKNMGSVEKGFWWLRNRYARKYNKQFSWIKLKVLIFVCVCLKV